jgi:hypothetical protein
MDLADLCSPVKIYLAFSVAMTLFHLFYGVGSRVFQSIFYMIAGTLFLYVLCAANMDFVAWGLLLFPIAFYILLFAIILFDRSFLSIKHQISPGSCEEPVCKPPSCVEEPSCESKQKEEERC